MATKVPAALSLPKSKVGSGRVVATKKKPAAVKSSDSKLGFGPITEAITKRTKAAFDQGNDFLDHTKAGKIIQGVVIQAADLSGEAYRGVTKAGKKIADNLSGAEVQASIGELVEKQRRYNDILATRLAEALDRIEELETQVARLSRGR